MVVNSELRNSLGIAMEDGRLSSRFWLYSNYHCNLSCTYCLTESSPTSAPRQLTAERMVDLSRQAKALGFASVGITGGEPFLRPDLVSILAEISSEIPVLVLTNGTLFNRRRVNAMMPLLESKHGLTLQISLDSAQEEQNDALRGANNFQRVAEAVPRLLAAGFHVRVAATLPETQPEPDPALQALLDRWGVAREDQLLRPVVHRGRAVLNTMGVEAGSAQLGAELTVTSAGAFWSPFGPTYREGNLETDLLLVRRTEPLAGVASVLLGLFADQPDLASDPAGFV